MKMKRYLVAGGILEIIDVADIVSNILRWIGFSLLSMTAGMVNLLLRVCIPLLLLYGLVRFVKFAWGD